MSLLLSPGFTYAVVAAAVLALLIIAGLGALLGVDVRREDD